jgi:crotonobetainyl-CoA:carnitine CoA-transferase CaiB-like acyl-CoA transferase
MRVLEVGQLLAGPFVGCILGYYGAEVIKIEPPGSGDPLRQWREIGPDGCSYWWRSLARNKKCVTANLREPEGRKLLAELAGRCDVLIENFRPGVMEKWGLGPEDLRGVNPGLIYARISGYGQDGPYADRPGFASVCEGVGGMRYVNGHPGEPPMRHNLSLGDSLAGVWTALAIAMACLHRERDDRHEGQVIDMALVEAVYNMLEGVIPEYSGAGVIREPSGSTITGIVPSNTYRCADGKYIVMGANADSMFHRLCEAMGRPDMASDPRLSGNAGRVKHQQEVDEAVAAWTGSLDSATVLYRLREARVPGGEIYNAADIMADPHFRARGMFESVEINGCTLEIPALAPKFSSTPGKTLWAGPELGEYNREVYGELLGLGADELERLAEAGVI